MGASGRLSPTSSPAEAAATAAEPNARIIAGSTNLLGSIKIQIETLQTIH
jgi:CO/xanthine dehydrogenase FAD-binding subunit